MFVKNVTDAKYAITRENVLNVIMIFVLSMDYALKIVPKTLSDKLSMEAALNVLPAKIVAQIFSVIINLNPANLLMNVIILSTIINVLKSALLVSS